MIAVFCFSISVLVLWLIWDYSEKDRKRLELERRILYLEKQAGITFEHTAEGCWFRTDSFTWYQINDKSKGVSDCGGGSDVSAGEPKATNASL